MTNPFKSILGSEFARNVLTLMTGTVLGQGIALLLSPIITRLFNAEDLAGLEQYTMLVVLFSVVVTGKYEFAIMSPKLKEDARHVVILAMRIAFFSCLAMFVLSFFLSDWVAGFYNNASLGKWLWTLPIALFALACFNIINYWFTRQKNFKVSATSKLWYAVASEPMKIGTGSFSLGSTGLYLSTVAGNLIAAVYCFIHFLRDEPRGIRGADERRIKELAVEYKEYPLFSIWGSILNRTAQWAHIGVFSHYYGIAAVGYMALCRRIFLAPLNILSNSYSQVFFQRISDLTSGKELLRFYQKNLWRFMGLAILLVAAVQVLPDNTMGFVFGEEWTPTMQYLKILSFWFGLNFVTSSLSFITYRIRIQRTALVLDALHFVFIYGSVLWSYWQGCDEITALKVLVLAKVVYFSLNIAVVLFYVHRYANKMDIQE